MGHGHEFDHPDAEAVWDEVRAVWPAGAGMTYDRLDEPGGLQWPCPDVDHPGTTLLHTETFAGAPRARLRALTYRPPSEVTDDDLPFTLVTGRDLYKFNAGTMTSRSGAGRLCPADLLELSPHDAGTLGVVSGDPMVVTSRYGTATFPVTVTDRVSAGMVFATFSDPEAQVNFLTGPHRDRTTRTPAYKVTAVRLVPA
jgi:formate dehydrogenase major subunit